jgi:hypothetical protein
MPEIQVLFFAADPFPGPAGRPLRLRLDEELRHIVSRVRASEYRDIIRFDVRWAIRADDLLQALNETNPQVVHFSGHGESKGLALVEPAGGKALILEAAALDQLFNIFRGAIRLVVLSACFSPIQAEAIAAAVGCVVGTRSTISERAAITFSSTFYRALAFGHSVKTAYEQARAALALEHFEDREAANIVVRGDIDPAQLRLVEPVDADARQREAESVAAPMEVRDLGTSPTQARSSRTTPMYSLIVTSEPAAWDGRRYGMPLLRFAEHTTEGVRARFITLDEPAVRDLMALPALLAYEEAHNRPARVARITRVVLSSHNELRFDFEPVMGIAPIPAELLSKLRWELDITDWEMNRTHWAIKEIDLMEVLREAGLLHGGRRTGGRLDLLNSGAQPEIYPTVFAIPTAPRDPKLVAVMMPFSHDFSDTYQEIQNACETLGLRCERADTIWEETTIIQDVFNLIYRSAVTIIDLSGRNPNVMYECGIAHTLGRPVLPISRSVEGLPFDLAHHRILSYLPNAEGLSQMRKKLESRLRSMTDTG